MNIKRFTIENFQSIKHLDLDFTKSGVFHLTGANNIGKSSIVRALKAHLLNVSNRNYKDYVRSGATNFKTTLIDFDGNVTVLSRGKQNDFYAWMINGKQGKLQGTQGKVPKVVSDYFNLYYDADEKELLNIRDDNALLMFAKTTPAANFRVFQRALGTGDFVKGAKWANQSSRENKVKLNTYDDLLHSAKEDSFGISYQDLANSLDHYNLQLEQQEKVVKKNVAVLNKVYGVKDIADDLVALGTVDKKKLAVLDNIDWEQLEDDVNTLELLYKVADLVQDFATAKVAYNKADAKLEEVVKVVTKVDSEILLATKVAEQQRAVKSLVDVTTKAQKVDKAIKVVDDRIADLKADLDICPFCGQSMVGVGGHEHHA